MSSDRFAFKIHPRVFAALGADLVTNDVVAVMELVKNSYDAFATRVDVSFTGTNGERCLEVLDNGTGMDRKTLEDAWFVVATPYRRIHPVAVHNKRTRRVSGEKGLGRLSVARLGRKLEMITKAANDDCWEVRVDWDDLAAQSSLEGCTASCRRFTKRVPFEKTGTLVRILGLQAQWEPDQLLDLSDNLAARGRSHETMACQRGVRITTIGDSPRA